MRRPPCCPAILALLPMAVVGAVPAPLQAASTPRPGPPLRVLLLEAPQARVEAPRGRLQLSDGAQRILAALPAAQGLRVLVGADGGIRIEGLVPGTLQAGSVGRELWLEVSSDPGEPLGPADGLDGAFALDKRPYRGRLQVLVEAGQLRFINHLDLETYLTSVVGSEMPASWPQQALRAQAVAARTYALRERRPAEPFDLRATVASQVYRGIEAETASTREAVQATRAQVLTYDGALIQAVFHSSSGTATEDSGAVWSRQLPYLVSVPDFDRSSPVSTWTLRFTGSQLRQLFPDTGGVSRFEVLAVSASGRVRQVRVEGPLGQRLLSGADLRRLLGLRSTQVRFEPLGVPSEGPVDGAAASSRSSPAPVTPAAAALVPSTPSLGPPALPPLTGSAALAVAPPVRPPSGWLLTGRGFGHGVGMSQWGAYGLAQQGMDYTGILRHYYRGTSLVTLEEPSAPAATVRPAALAADLAPASGRSGLRP